MTLQTRLAHHADTTGGQATGLRHILVVSRPHRHRDHPYIRHCPFNGRCSRSALVRTPIAQAELPVRPDVVVREVISFVADRRSDRMQE
jgi:hypothetical protein